MVRMLVRASWEFWLFCASLGFCVGSFLGSAAFESPSWYAAAGAVLSAIGAVYFNRVSSRRISDYYGLDTEPKKRGA